jgi:lactam utilization protein B
VTVFAATVCVHGDNPRAIEFVRQLRRRLDLEEVMIAAPARRL